MTDPLNPNFKPGVGRLATDRFDFQKHVEGLTNHHKAISIDLNPSVVVNGSPTLNVQEALEQLATSLNPPVIQDATTFQKGIIQLTGDIAGAATNIRVVALRGYPVNTSAPSISDVLTWNGSSWGPAPNPNPFTAAGDLAGNNTLQTVVNITGNGAFVTSTASEILFEDTVITPFITHRSISSGSAGNFKLTAQATSDSAGNGGTVVISGGERGFLGGSNLNGGVDLRIGTNTPTTMVHCVETVQGKRVLGLVSNTPVTSTQMSSSTGDRVIYISNASTVPTAPPVGGSILYSTSGALHVRQSDNTDVTIGVTPNPDVWGSVIRGDQSNASGQVYNFRNVVTTIGSGATTAIPFTVPMYTSVYVEVVMIGKKDGYLEATNHKMSAGFVREAGSASKLLQADTFYFDAGDGDGVKYVEHMRSTFLALGWTQPTITLSGNTINIKTGDTGIPSQNTTWFTVAKFYTGPSYTNP